MNVSGLRGRRDSFLFAMADVTGVIVVAGVGIVQPIGFPTIRGALLNTPRTLLAPEQTGLDRGRIGQCRCQIPTNGESDAIPHFIVIGDGVGALIVLGINLPRYAHLPQIAQAIDALGRAFPTTQHGKKERGENRDDRNYDQQFNQGEAAPPHDVNNLLAKYPQPIEPTRLRGVVGEFYLLQLLRRESIHFRPLSEIGSSLKNVGPPSNGLETQFHALAAS